MTEEKKNHSLAGDVLIFVATILFAGYSLFLRLNPQISALLFLFAFQVVGALAFVVIIIFNGLPKISKYHLWLLIILAIISLLHDFSYFLSFQTTTVSNATVGHQTSSIFLLFFAPYFLKEKTTRNEWIAVIFGILGTLFLFRNEHPGKIDWQNIEGILLSILAGMLSALQIILYKHLQVTEQLTIRVINFFRYTLSFIILLPFFTIFKEVSFTPHVVTMLFSFGLLYAVIASGILQLAIGWSRAMHVSIIGKCEPVFASVYALFLLKEVPTWNSVVGGIIIIATSIWLALPQKKEAAH